MAFPVPIQTFWTPFAQRNTLKIPIYLYTRVTGLHLVCTCSLSHYDPHTSGNVPKNKIFGVFLIKSWIAWLLDFHILGNDPIWPFTSYWRAIYWATWMHWRRRTCERKETLIYLCPILAYLSLHPFVLWGVFDALPKLVFVLWACHWEGRLK